MRSKTRRLPGETVSMTLDVAAANGEVAHHKLEMTMAYADGILHEISFGGRGKIGQGMDHLLTDLGIKISRALQGRDPDTGDEP